jgi:integrase
MAPLPSPLPADTLQTLRHYMRKARAASTQRAYASQWQGFVAWCKICNCSCLPADPQVVAAYLAARAQAGAKVASVNVMVAAIAFAHKAKGVIFDRQHAALTLVLDGIRRAHVQHQQQAEPLTGDILRELLARFGDTSLDRRDAALLGLLYAFALRASEAVSLDWTKLGQGRGWLRIAPDRAEVVLLGSKAAQGETESILIPALANPATLQALQDWVRHAGIRPGEPLLRPITRGGAVRGVRMQVGSVSGVIKRAMARHLVRTGMPAGEAGAMASRFSGHSGRLGLYISATEAGVASEHIAALARHASLAMVRRYARRADMLKCAPHLARGVGV